jgi:hypothetical protein
MVKAYRQNGIARYFLPVQLLTAPPSVPYEEVCSHFPGLHTLAPPFYYRAGLRILSYSGSR